MDLDAQRLLIANLLVKVGIIAVVAAVLVRSARFKQLVFRDRRSVRENLELGVYLGFPVAVNTLLRAAFRYNLPDVGLEGALLAGVLGGYVSGLTAGVLVALPALLDQEWLALPVCLAAGAAGGLARRLSAETDNIWHFSPFVDMNIYRWYQRRFGVPRGQWQLMFFFLIVAVEAYTMTLGRWLPGSVFTLHSPSKLLLVAIVAAGIAAIAIPIKIFNSIRNELKIEEQNRLLAEARMMALTSQINPHFLFNTLNSISSLVRTDPDLARQVILKLSHILRRLLRRQETFTPLRAELDLVKDYLSIERVRMGDKLQYTAEIDPGALDTLVPSMLLQPLVENSIKHGISPKIEGGSIHISGRRDNGRVILEIRDNGVGIAPERQDDLYEEGIGLSNVRERIKVLYGSDCAFRVVSQPGQGTTVEIELPDLPAK
jgi:two-component system LytT family sensor kinase